MSDAVYKKKVAFPIGGMWEYSNWDVHVDAVITVWADTVPCKHCHSPSTITHANPTYTQEQCICPFVVVAENEARFNSTGVCMQCIVEAYQSLDKGGK